FKIELYSCPILGLCSGCSKNSLRRSQPALSGAYAMEDAMKLSVILLTLAFMGVAFAGQTTPASDKKEATADTKETRWQGHIVGPFFWPEVQAFAANASRRSLAARAVSRSSGSESLRQRFNSPSKDFIPNVPMAYAPQDLSQGSSLVTNATTACSWFSTLARTSRCARRARSATVTLPSSSGTSISRNCDFKTLSRNSSALSYTDTFLDCSPR